MPSKSIQGIDKTSDMKWYKWYKTDTNTKCKTKSKHIFSQSIQILF